eukprot:m.207417 g.207417  ORF g.207417 m.207417 type:complete len:614 (-) comp10710_c0_seq2:195-2036(-)
MGRMRMPDGPLADFKPVCDGDGKWTLEFEVRPPACYRDEHSERISHVVSLLGATHAGKSFVSNHLVYANYDMNEEETATQSEQDNFRPTTSGINDYIWHSDVDEDDPDELDYIRLVDFEGSDASRVLPVTTASEAWDALKQSDRARYKELLQERVKRTRADLPRLAYLSSDVLVYVTRASPSQSATFTELAEFTERCCHKTVRESPALILVFNMQRPSKMSEEELTEQLLDLHDSDDELRARFSEIYCIMIPDLEVERPESVQAFQGQVDKLREQIFATLRLRAKKRAELGLLYKSALWPPIFRHFVQELPSEGEISQMQIILSALAETSAGMEERLAVLFNQFLAFRPYRGQPAMLAHHFRLIAKMFVATVLLGYQANSESMRIDVSTQTMSDALLNIMRDELAHALQVLKRPFAPCGSQTSGGVNDESGNAEPIRCCILRGEHSEHANPYRLIPYNSATPSLFARVSRFLSRAVGSRETFRAARWAGPFVPVRNFDAVLEVSQKEALELFPKLFDLGLPIARVCVCVSWAIVRNRMHLSDDQIITREVTWQNCLLCLGPSGRYEKCGHRICDDCQEIMHEVVIGDGAEMRKIYRAVGLEEIVHIGVCPICA